MSMIRSQPCTACPYRRDAPSGLWSAADYAKLPPYDNTTGAQPFAPFSCHATPEHLCNGWAVVHSSRGHQYELIALRLCGSPTIPQPTVPMFNSGTEAAEHGMRELGSPSLEARAAADRLMGKYPRLTK